MQQPGREVEKSEEREQPARRVSRTITADEFDDLKSLYNAAAARFYGWQYQPRLSAASLDSVEFVIERLRRELTPPRGD